MKNIRLFLLLDLFLFAIVSCSQKQEEQTYSISEMVAQTVAMQNAMESFAETANAKVSTAAIQPTSTFTAIPPIIEPFEKYNVNQVIDVYTQAGLEIQSPTIMEPNDYGIAPLVAVEGIHFLIPSLCIDCGGRIFSFDNQSDLDITKSYYDKLGESSAALFSWTFTKDNILVQINGELPQERANQYKDTLLNMGTQLSTSVENVVATEIIAPTQSIAPIEEIPTVDPNQTMSPVYYSGTGDSVIEVQPLPQSLLALHVTGNTSSSMFSINAHFEDGSSDLLVIDTKPYNGITALSDADKITMFEISAKDEWAIGIYDLKALQTYNSSAYIYGMSDSLVLINQDSNSIHVVGNAQSNAFSVTAYTSSSYPTLMIIETSPYDGTVLLPNGTYMIEVKATGEWFINP